MPSRKIKNSWWVDFRFDRQRYRMRSPENSKIGATAYEFLLRTRLSKGEKINEQSETKAMPTFAEFSKKWFDCYVLTNNKPSEQMHKQSALHAHLTPFFGNAPLSEISNQKIEEFKSAKLQLGLKAKTINNLTAILAKCLRTAVEWEIIEKIPRIQKLKVPPYKFDFLTTEEEILLIKTAPGVWKEMIVMAVDTGLRLGEMAALDWPSVNFEKKEIVVRRSFTVKQMSAPKSNRERRIPMTNRVYQMLLNKSERMGLVFTIEPNRPILQNRCLNNLVRICLRANLRRIHWHSLRHTFASRLISHGASLKALQMLMGHSDIQTTMRYAHLEPNVLNNTMGILDELQNFGQPVGNATKKQEVNAFC